MSDVEDVVEDAPIDNNQEESDQGNEDIGLVEELRSGHDEVSG